MLGLSLETLFAEWARLHGCCIVVLGGIASAILLQACSPTPDPCGPHDTQQAGACASLRANPGAFSGPPVCGDGIKTGNEECDGEDLGGVTCEMIGAGSGTLLCDPATCRFVFFQCSSSIGGGGTITNTGGVSGIGGAGGATETGNCTPNTEETEACGGCGQKIRTCQPTGTWGEWSLCNDPCGIPLCASQARLPSWESSIGQTVQPFCGSPGCHTEANSYDGFVSWYNTVNGISAGLFETYLSPSHYNPRSSQTEYDVLKCWIALGMPRTDAEIGSGN
jgi:hypothetical protein